MINLQLTMDEVNSLLEGLSSKINEANSLRIKVYQIAQAQVDEQKRQEELAKEKDKEESSVKEEKGESKK